MIYLSLPTIVVTRHPALSDYLVMQQVIAPGTPVVAHASPDLVRDKHVIGILPLYLAALAYCVTTVPLDLPPELRGVELTLDQIAQHACPIRTYWVLAFDLPQECVDHRTHLYEMAHDLDDL